MRAPVQDAAAVALTQQSRGLSAASAAVHNSRAKLGSSVVPNVPIYIYNFF
jgi:hypothetical protein